jgi:hypothetical protein
MLVAVSGAILKIGNVCNPLLYCPLPTNVISIDNDMSLFTSRYALEQLFQLVGYVLSWVYGHDGHSSFHLSGQHCSE